MLQAPATNATPPCPAAVPAGLVGGTASGLAESPAAAPFQLTPNTSLITAVGLGRPAEHTRPRGPAACSGPVDHKKPDKRRLPAHCFHLFDLLSASCTQPPLTPPGPLPHHPYQSPTTLQDAPQGDLGHPAGLPRPAGGLRLPGQVSSAPEGAGRPAVAAAAAAAPPLPPRRLGASGSPSVGMAAPDSVLAAGLAVRAAAGGRRGLSGPRSPAGSPPLPPLVRQPSPVLMGAVPVARRAACVPCGPLALSAAFPDCRRLPRATAARRRDSAPSQRW